MKNLNKIVTFLDNYLDIKNVKDDSWNGLQVEGKQEVKIIAFGVTAGMELFEKAADINADMIIVHHGIFWSEVDPTLKGYAKNRIKFLFDNEVSLYASHIPLDKHQIVGNNIQLLDIIGFKKDKEFAFYKGQNISFTGKNNNPKSLYEIENILKKEIGATCKVLPFGKKEISSIAVCSGGAGWGPFMEAVNLGVDLYVTGDSTEMYHTAKDVGINIIFAGHHATETVGVAALSRILKKEFGVETIFFNIPTGL